MPDDQVQPTLGGRDLIGLGGLLVGAVVLGLVVGLVLDRLLGSSPAFTLLGLLLGVGLGAWGFYLRVRVALSGR